MWAGFFLYENTGNTVPREQGYIAKLLGELATDWLGMSISQIGNGQGLLFGGANRSRFLS
jgi:hypothetical protein